MKKIILINLVVIALSTNAMAKTQPYIGTGLNNFKISSDIITNFSIGENKSTTSESSSDSGKVIGLNGGVLLDNNKINFSYYSGIESGDDIVTATVISVSYDYSLGENHKGWYCGIGISSVTTKWDDMTKDAIVIQNSSESSIGLLARFGYENMISSNLFFDINYNINTTKQNHKVNVSYDGANVGISEIDMLVNELNLSINYLF